MIVKKIVTAKLRSPKVFFGFCCALIAAIALPEPAYAAIAAGDFNELATNFVQKELPALLFLNMAVAYCCGIFMTVAGVLRVKQHAESHGNEKLAPGITKLIAGGMLASVPTFTQIMQATTQIGHGGMAPYNAFWVEF